MSGGISALAVGTIAKGYLDKKNKEHAAEQSSKFLIEGQENAIDEQRSQFDNFTKMLQPYLNAGTDALAQQRDILGLGGADRQQAVFDMLQGSPAYTSQLDIGENRIRQNASATGGLRGGDVQAALGQFGPSILTNLINQQFTRLGGLTDAGQTGATNLGNAGMNMANQIGGYYTGIGQANAGREIAQGQANSDYFNDLYKAFSMAVGGFDPSTLGGTTPGTTPNAPTGDQIIQGAGQTQGGGTFDINGNYVPYNPMTNVFQKYGVNVPGGGF